MQQRAENEDQSQSAANSPQDPAPAVDDQSVANSPQPSAAAVSDPGDSAFVQSAPARAREEVGMLLVGFATGLSIGVVFLVYVVLALAGLFH